MRDSQRQRVYDAEDAVFRGTDPLGGLIEGTDKRLATSVRAYIRYVLSLKRVQGIFVPGDPRSTSLSLRLAHRWVWWKRGSFLDLDRPATFADRIQIDIVPRMTGGWAFTYRPHLQFGRGPARRKHFVLHELAHILLPPKVQHGWQFAYMLLELTKYAIGREAHDALKAAFKVHKVKYRPPRAKRVLTPEQRETLRARMQTLRTSRAAKVRQQEQAQDAALLQALGVE